MSHIACKGGLIEVKYSYIQSKVVLQIVTDAGFS